MGTTARKLRKRAGVQLVKPVKVPTPVLERSHTWRQRFSVTRGTQVRPSRIAIVRYGVRDLGWQSAEKYMTGAGKLTKAARA